MSGGERGADATGPDLVCVFRAGDEGLVGIVKSILDGEEILYIARGAEMQDLFGVGRIGGGYNYVVGPVEFMVRPEDADRARAVLDALREGFLSGGAAEPDDA